MALAYCYVPNKHINQIPVIQCIIMFGVRVCFSFVVLLFCSAILLYSSLNFAYVLCPLNVSWPREKNTFFVGKASREESGSPFRMKRVIIFKTQPWEFRKLTSSMRSTQHVFSMR